MSHQSGIKPNSQLRDVFAKCRSGKVRLVKIVIKDEQLTLEHEIGVQGNWEQDYTNALPMVLEEKQPCYVFFKMDNTDNEGGEDWTLITFTPDAASVRNKMLLAATRATLKQEFGVNYIKDEFNTSAKEQTSIGDYKRHMFSKRTPGPMTEVERQLAGAQTITQRSVAPKAAQTLADQTLRGLSFPIDQDAQEVLKNFASQDLNYVQLSVDTLNEAIKLEDSALLENPSDELGGRIPRQKPRFHFFRTPAMVNQNGEIVKKPAIYFIYSMPSSQVATIKERMMYSSCKMPFLDEVDRLLRMKPDKKIEVDAYDSTFLLIQLGLMAEANQNGGDEPKFQKPKGPQVRGSRRIH